MAARHTTVQCVINQHTAHTAALGGVLTQPHSAAAADTPLCQPFSSCSTPAAAHADLAHFHTLLQQLNEVGWDRASLSGNDLRQLVLHLQDAAGRCHRAQVQLPAGFPVAAPTVALQSLPAPFRLRWLPGDSLATLATQLDKALQSYQALWEQLEDLDSHTQLLDPPATLAQPYSSCSRCIALGNGASCQLKLLPTAPCTLPSSIIFHGPSTVVAGLQSRWYSSAHRLWQEQLSVRQNLEAILQVSLPPPKPGVRKGCAAHNLRASAGTPAGSQPGLLQHSQADDDSPVSSDAMEDDDEQEAGACSICYTLHLQDPDKPEELGAAPSVTCQAEHCGKAFHAACLAEWLGALPSSRRVFDTLFGSCPFCQAPIGVSTRVTG